MVVLDFLGWDLLNIETLAIEIGIGVTVAIILYRRQRALQAGRRVHALKRALPELELIEKTLSQVKKKLEPAISDIPRLGYAWHILFKESIDIRESTRILNQITTDTLDIFTPELVEALRSLLQDIEILLSIKPEGDDAQIIAGLRSQIKYIETVLGDVTEVRKLAGHKSF